MLDSSHWDPVEDGLDEIGLEVGKPVRSNVGIQERGGVSENGGQCEILSCHF